MYSMFISFFNKRQRDNVVLSNQLALSFDGARYIIYSYDTKSSLSFPFSPPRVHANGLLFYRYSVAIHRSPIVLEKFNFLVSATENFLSRCLKNSKVLIYKYICVYTHERGK